MTRKIWQRIMIVRYGFESLAGKINMIGEIIGLGII
jgi:hypothetical protein